MGPPVARSAGNPWVVGWCLGLENKETSSPVRVEPTAARVLPKLVPNKSLSEWPWCEGPNEKRYVRSFLD